MARSSGQDARETRVRYTGESRSSRPYEAYPPILDLLEAREGRTLLDVNCGTGLMLKAAYARGLVSHGVDSDPGAVACARRNSPPSTVTIARACDLGYPDGTFDYVTCIDSFHLFDDPDGCLAELRRVTRAEALICIAVPTHGGVPRTRGAPPGGRRGSPESLAGWRRLFVANGMEVAAVCRDRYAAGCDGPGGGGIVELSGGRISRLAWHLTPRRFAGGLLFLLRKESVARPEPVGGFAIQGS